MKDDIAADPQLRARFVFEAEITGNLEHPGIVPVYGKGESTDGRPYYAMRFIRGETLKAAADRFHKDSALRSEAGVRQRDFQKLVRRFLVVCETMAYAHSRGIIHRDLKPRNIMLGPYGETLVVDWGLAKVVGHHDVDSASEATLRPPSGSDVQPTGAGSRVGTPGYMSPEQARGEIDRLGPPADIYSLGATLYYMLTRQSPFADQDLPDVLIKIERGEFFRPNEVKSAVDPALEAICLKAMKTQPDDRYASCRAFADDLELWLADQPVKAYPEPLFARTMRWMRHRKQLVAATGALLALTLGGVLYHDWRLGTEKGRVEQARDQAASQLKITRTALRELLSVAWQRLANLPQTEELRAELAGKVLEDYQKLLESNPGDPETLLEIARVHRVIGIIDRVTGQVRESEEAFNRSIDTLHRLVAASPLDMDAWELLSETLINRAQLYHMNGQTRKAEAEYRAALIEAGHLATGRSRTAYFRLRADALLALAGLFMLRGQKHEGHSAASEAVQCLEDATGESVPPATADRVRWMLMIALTYRADMARYVVDRDAAIADLQRAIAEAAKFPPRSDYRTTSQLQCSNALNLLAQSWRKSLSGGPMPTAPSIRRSS